MDLNHFYQLLECHHIKFQKFLVPRINSVTPNEFTVKDAFCFARGVIEQNHSLVMGNLNVDSLFTNIRLDETIDICSNTFYSEQDVIEDINKEEFWNLLSLATKESYFSVSEVLYKQKDGVAVGSPLGLTLANNILCFYERKWLEKYPPKFYGLEAEKNFGKKFHPRHVYFNHPVYLNLTNFGPTPFIMDTFLRKMTKK